MTLKERNFNSQPPQTRYYLVWTYADYLHTKWEQEGTSRLRADLYHYDGMVIAVVNRIYPTGKLVFVDIAAMAYKNMDPFIADIELTDLFNGEVY